MARFNLAKLRVLDDDDEEKDYAEDDFPDLEELMQKQVGDASKTESRDVCERKKTEEDSGVKPPKTDDGCCPNTTCVGNIDDTNKMAAEETAVEIHTPDPTEAAIKILTAESRSVDTKPGETARGRTRTRRPLRAAHVNTLLLPLSRTLRESLPDQDYESEDSEGGPIRRIGQEDPPTNIYGANIWIKSSRAVRDMSERATKGVRTNAQRRPFLVEEEEETGEESDDEFDSLDDFIVGDDEDISYYDTQDECEEAEEEQFTKPSSPRKLYRGITPKSTWNKENNTTRLTDSEKVLQPNPYSQNIADLRSPLPKCDMEPAGLLIKGRKTLEEALQADGMDDSNGPQTFVKL